MTEAKTLDEWFEGRDRGDGRKFRLSGGELNKWYEPIYREKGDKSEWYSLDRFGKTFVFRCDAILEEYHPPKKTKTVKLYRPVFKYKDGTMSIGNAVFYSKEPHREDWYEVFAWHEIEVEVEE